MATDRGATHYAVLGVETTATTMQIRTAYRAKAKHAHPDAGGDPAAFRRLLEAYQTLTDERERRSYDDRMGITHAPAGRAGAPGSTRRPGDTFTGDVEFPAYLRDITDRPWEPGLAAPRAPTAEDAFDDLGVTDPSYRDPGGSALPADVVWWWPEKAQFAPVAAPPLLVAATVRELVALTILDGHEAWRVDLGASLAAPPVVAGDVTVAWTADGNLHAVDMGRGVIRWQVALGTPTPGGLAAAGLTVAAARADLRLVGVDATTGRATWTAKLQAPATVPLTHADGLLLAITGGKVVEAVDARRGRHRWRVTLKTPVPLAPVVSAGAVWLAGGGRTGALVRLDVATGALRGMADSGSAVAGMAATDELAFVTGAGPARLRVFDERGDVRVELGLPNVCPEPAIGRDHIYLADPTGRLITVDRATGRPSGVATVPFEPLGPPLLVADRAVMLARDGRLWAVAV